MRWVDEGFRQELDTWWKYSECICIVSPWYHYINQNRYAMKFPWVGWIVGLTFQQNLILVGFTIPMDPWPLSEKLRRTLLNPVIIPQSRVLRRYGWNYTWWLIPLSKWVITPVISGSSLLIPFLTGVITHFLRGMSHQVGYFINPVTNCWLQKFPIWLVKNPQDFPYTLRKSWARLYLCVHEEAPCKAVASAKPGFLRFWQRKF